ncbi:MAG: DUF3866 family protein [Nocardioidaceae bacterium]
MIRWRQGVVVAIGPSWVGARELDVDTPEGRVKALAYTELVGSPAPGERVLLNTTAYDQGLGTGGYALVVAVPDSLPPDPVEGRPGHLVKARYTPLQTTVLGIDEQDSPAHRVLADADDLGGMPVVGCDLHSAVPAVVAGVREQRPDARVAYLMTDGAALPLAFSRTVAGLVAAGWLATTITVGQAYGGLIEAVSVHSGLLAARHVAQADVVVVAQGPGNLGTGTRWGFSGVALAEALHATDVLGGSAVAGLRVSAADRRERHYGVSHHSLTAYGRATLVPVDVVVPDLAGDFGSLVRHQARVLSTRHRLVPVDVGGLMAALQESPVALSTMGRGLTEDPTPFLASAAAGRHAAQLASR